MRRTGVLMVAVVLAVLASAKDREFVMPKAFHAKTYPARDAHEQEKFSIAADPYDTQDKILSVFSTDYRAAGILPIHIIFSNDADEPVSIVDVHVRLVTRDRTRIEPDEPQDIYRRISRQRKRGDEPGKVQIPIPLPKKAQRTVTRAAEEEITQSRMMARAIEPHSSRGGFYFFDVYDIENPVAGARVVISGVQKANGQEMFYFEIPLEKYLTYQPGKE
jgi:hypothetical protein